MPLSDVLELADDSLPDASNTTTGASARRAQANAVPTLRGSALAGLLP